MNDAERATNTALRAAFETRRALALPRDVPVNPFDIASRLGLDVRFMDCPSLEGMYLRNARCRIFLPHRGHRPRGRLAFTCAHEVGHHQLGHGTTADRYLENGSKNEQRSPEELGADIYAAHLLMPRQAVLASFTRRGLRAENPSPRECFLVAQELGVGFAALVNQLSIGLGVLSIATASKLRKCAPKALRADLFPASAGSDLLIIDEHWKASLVDLTARDYIAFHPQFEVDSTLFQSLGTLTSGGHRVYKPARRGAVSIAGANMEQFCFRIADIDFVGTYHNSFTGEAD